MTATAIKAGVVALALVVGGCVDLEIARCGSACVESGGRMLSYSEEDGCRCEYDKPAEENGGA